MGSARPLDFGHWAAHKLESLTRQSPAPRRGGRDRHRARHALLARESACCRPPAVERVLGPARAARLPPLGRGAGRSGSRPGGPRPRRARRVPRAPRRRAHRHAAGRGRPGRRGARRCASRSWSAPSTGCAAATAAREAGGAGRAAPHLLHQHPSRGDAGPRCAPTSSATCWRSRQRVAPDRPFGVGLRLSAAAADELAAAGGARRVPGVPRATRPLRLHDQRLPVRRLPRDARQGGGLPPRLAATTRASRTATAWPACSPRCCRPSRARGQRQHRAGRVQGAASAARPTMAGIAERLVRHAATLHGIRERTGKIISLALEPEPCCHLETIAETVRFFEEHLFAAPAVAAFGRPRPASARRARGGAAPPPRRVLRRLPHGGRVRGRGAPGSPRSRARGHPRRQGAGQRRAARAEDPRRPRAAWTRSGPSPTASTCTRSSSARDGALTRYLDLPEALAAPRATGRRPASGGSTSTCRSSARSSAASRSTQPYLRELLALRRERPLRRTSRSRRTPGTCCPRSTAARTSRRGRARARVGARRARRRRGPR